MHTTDDLLQEIAKLRAAIWWAANQSHVAGGVTGLAPGREIRVFCSGGSTHLTIDVTGYYL